MINNKPRFTTSTITTQGRGRGGAITSTTLCHLVIKCALLALLVLLIQLGDSHNDNCFLGLNNNIAAVIEKDEENLTTMMMNNNIVLQQDHHDNNDIIMNDQKNANAATKEEEEEEEEAVTRIAAAEEEEAAAKIVAQEKAAAASAKAEEAAAQLAVAEEAAVKEAAAAAAAKAKTAEDAAAAKAVAKEAAAAKEAEKETAATAVMMVPVAATTNTKPTLLLHLGPPKTSTTYLQCILTNMMDTLALDNYVYLGLHVWQCLDYKIQKIIPNPLNTGTDFIVDNNSKPAALAVNFLLQLRQANANNHNVIIMNECLNEYTLKQRQLIYNEFSMNWNVKLIINYRRAYELLPSSYNQNHKPNIYRTSDYESLTLWPNETNNKNKNINGTTVIGVPLLPFNIDNDYIIKNLLIRIEGKGRFGHPVDEGRVKYPFPDVNIIKMHELARVSHGDALLQEMFCRIVDNGSTPHSCAAVQLDETIKIGQLENNPYYSFNYDMLATAAYEKQLFGFQKRNEVVQPRRSIAERIQQHQEDTLHLTHHDFNTTCLEQDKMDRILNASITSEKVIYGDDVWTPQHEDNLRQAFKTYQEKKSYVYCWINTEATLQDPTWLAFFDTL